MRFLLFLLLVLLPNTPLSSTDTDGAKIQWQNWSGTLFEDAKKQNKLVYLNLEAVWCHWCHVMEEKTYSNKEIADLMGKSFINVKVDQDSHPELSLRYREYGWPATIIFNAKGEEIKKLSGYIEAPKLLKILQSSISNPSSDDSSALIEKEFASDAALTAKYREELVTKHYDSLDYNLGGLRTKHKFVDAETLEYSIIHAAKGATKDTEWIKTTLKSNLKLIDPVWGGVYQYSTFSDWINPHFEKIIHSQADNLLVYSLAYQLWKEEESWKAATDIYKYVKSTLTSPEGAFYTSQDADYIKGRKSTDYFKLGDEERRKLGTPRVDKSVYSKENGLMINALVALYSATDNRTMLDDAIKAAEWIIANRSLRGGGFKHGDQDIGGPFLGDTLAMGRSFLALHSATGDRRWLKLATGAADFINANFVGDSGGAPGLFASKPQPGSVLAPYKDQSENILAARFFNLLSHYSGNSAFKKTAEQAMRYLATPGTSKGYINDSGILLADYELSREPLHITVVGHKDDPQSLILFQAGLRYFSTYKRLEWWDKREGPMANPDVEYPQMSKPAAFICTNKRCSLPIFKPEKIDETIKLFHKDNK